MKTMRHIITSVCLLATVVPCAFAQFDPKTMDNYVFTLIWSRTDRRTTTKEEGERIQGAHMAHIEAMAKQGSLVAAGPAFAKDSRLRGIFIFHLSMDQAKDFANADPAAKEGLLEMESHPWLAYKGIGEPYKLWRAANPDAQVKMVTYQLALLRRGPNAAGTSRDEMEKLEKQHLDGLERNHRSGKIVAAGPMVDRGDLTGIVVFATSADEAKAILEKDAFVSRGMIKVDWYSWMAADGSFPPATTDK